MTDYKSQGLLSKYNYERSDGKPLDQTEELFTLRFDKNDAWGHACRETLKAFASRIRPLGYAQLADDLERRLALVETCVSTVSSATVPIADEPAALPEI